MDWGPSLTDCWGGAPGPNEGFLETMSDRGSECHVINLVTGVTEGGGGGGGTCHFLKVKERHVYVPGKTESLFKVRLIGNFTYGHQMSPFRCYFKPKQMSFCHFYTNNTTDAAPMYF